MYEFFHFFTNVRTMVSETGRKLNGKYQNYQFREQIGWCKVSEFFIQDDEEGGREKVTNGCRRF